MPKIIDKKPYTTCPPPRKSMPVEPRLDVEIFRPKNPQKRIKALAIVDTGADITTLSEDKFQELVNTLGKPDMKPLKSVDSNGNIMNWNTYIVWISIKKYPGRGSKPKEFIFYPEFGIDHRNGIYFSGKQDDVNMLLGRDVLTGLKAIFDVPTKGKENFTLEVNTKKAMNT